MICLVTNKEIEIFNEKVTYSGEVNAKGEPHGEGEFVTKNGIEFNGYFRNKMPQSYCKKNYGGYFTLGEIVDGKWEGKATDYFWNGSVFNRTCVKGMTEESIFLLAPEDAWFGDGRPAFEDIL